MRPLHTLLLVSCVVAAGPAIARADGAASDGDAAPAPPAAAPAPAADTDAAPPRAPDRATLVHVPPGEARADHDVELTAVIDAAWTEPTIVAHWRTRGDGAWHDAPFQRSSAGGWFATIPGDGVARAGVEYRIAGLAAGREVVHFASAEAPQPVPVVPALLDELALADRARHHGRTEQVAVDVDAQDFGNRFDDEAGPRHRDRYVRAEARWTHRFYRGIYAAGFGFGAIDGITLSDATAAATELDTRARYGFGEVRTRLHPAIFVDLRGTLGVSHDGFVAGAGAAITFGRPWATCVTVGGEGLQDLGGSGYVRLQWDTAPPLLMGASVIRTDLPGAVLADGVQLRYDVAYPMTGGVTLRGSLSAGARDGRAHVGGGLGASYEF